MDVPDLIRELLTELDYAEHLRKSHQDWESRWENVQELINFATEAPSPTEIAQELGITAVEGKQDNASTETINASGSAPPPKVVTVIDLTEDDQEDEQPSADAAPENMENAVEEGSNRYVYSYY